MSFRVVFRFLRKFLSILKRLIAKLLNLSRGDDVLATRYLTEFEQDSNAETFISFPAYTGELTFKLYARDAGQTVAGVSNYKTYEWNTITVNVTNLTELGRGFIGIIADIQGVGLDIPVALSSGIEAPAALNGSKFIQFEVEDNDRGDWIRTENVFTPGSIIIESGFQGFAAGNFNNFRGFRQYFIDAKVEVIDANGDVIPDVYLEEESVRYIAGGQSSFNILRGIFLFGPDGYIAPRTSKSHYVQCSSPIPRRVRFTARASIVYKQPIVPKNWIFMLGQGQSLSVGGSSTTVDPSHWVPIRDRETFSTFGGSNPFERAGNDSRRYIGIRPWEEGIDLSTHIYSALTQINEVLPTNYRMLVDNNGQNGATIQTLEGYAATEWNNALQSVADGDVLNGIETLQEQAIMIWDQGESNSNDDTYKTFFRTLHDGIINVTQTQRPKVSGVKVFIGQLGGAQAYFKVANQLWEYATENDDAYLACAKYAIHHSYSADPVNDTVHLNEIGYDIQGAYEGAAINEVLFGSGQWRPFEPLQAWIDPVDDTKVIVRFHVPVLPIVKDTVRVPQIPGDGFLYRRADDSDFTPASTQIDGSDIVIDLGGQQAQVGDTIEIGNHSVNNLPGTNFHDSSTLTAAINGFNLYNDLVISKVVISNAPPSTGGGIDGSGVASDVAISAQSSLTANDCLTVNDCLTRNVLEIN